MLSNIPFHSKPPTCAKQKTYCANLREHLLMTMVGAGWVACCFVLAGCCWRFFALPRVELRRELHCEVKNYSSVKNSLLVGRSTKPCQQTLLLLAGGLNLGSCPYRILREILRKPCAGFGLLFFARCLPTRILS